MASIRHRDPEMEGSFSFSSCYDFPSSLGEAFSDYDESDDESYIEIALEPKNPTHQYDKYGDPDEEVNCWDKEMEIRISFSSSVALPVADLSAKPKSVVDHCKFSTSSSSPTFTFSASSASSSFKDSTRGDPVEPAAANGKEVPRTTIRRRVQFPAVNRYINTLISGAAGKSSEIDPGNRSTDDVNHLNLVRSSRNAPKLTSNGIMMKFLIKFRSLKLQTLVASFMKTCQAKTSQEKGPPYKEKRSNEAFGAYLDQRSVKPFDKCLLQSKRRKSNRNSLFVSGDRSRMLEMMNLDRVEGVMETVTTTLGFKDRKTKSCPNSIKSSPFHQGFPSETYKVSIADNSIQAAIAHCKKSLAPYVA